MNAKLKTQKTGKSVKEFLEGIEETRKRADAFALSEILKQVLKQEPKMWGTSIVGAGDYHYKHESGREGDWFMAGFSPRKQNLTLYLMSGFGHDPDLLARLGKFKTEGSCLHFKTIEDIDTAVLKKLIARGVKRLGTKTK